MPRRPKDAEGGVDQFGRPLRSAGRALAGVSLRRGRLRRLPAQVLVRASAPREGSAGYDPPAGGSAAGGEGIPAKRGVRTVSQATSGRRTQAGAADATRRSPGTLLRSDEDLLQLLMAATVANLTLVATRIGLMRDRNHPQTVISTHVYALFVFRHAFTTLPLRPEPGFSATLLERVMNSIRNRIGMRETEIAKKPSRPWNPHSYAVFAQVHNTL